MSAGYDHSCGVTPAGAAYCWGNNDLGQLGNGSITDSPTPVAVAGGHSFVDVSAGSFWHSCGLTASGEAYCWGENVFGELGDGTDRNDRLWPVIVYGGLRFAAVTAGFEHTCGLTVTGATYCWGRGGMLGNGSDASSSTPVPVSGGLWLSTAGSPSAS